MTLNRQTSFAKSMQLAACAPSIQPLDTRLTSQRWFSRDQVIKHKGDMAAGMVGEALTPGQKLINRYIFNGAVFTGLSALVIGRFAWVRDAVHLQRLRTQVANYCLACTESKYDAWDFYLQAVFLPYGLVAGCVT